MVIYQRWCCSDHIARSPRSDFARFYWCLKHHQPVIDRTGTNRCHPISCCSTPRYDNKIRRSNSSGSWNFRLRSTCGKDICNVKFIQKSLNPCEVFGDIWPNLPAQSLFAPAEVSTALNMDKKVASESICFVSDDTIAMALNSESLLFLLSFFFLLPNGTPSYLVPWLSLQIWATDRGFLQMGPRSCEDSNNDCTRASFWKPTGICVENGKNIFVTYSQVGAVKLITDVGCPVKFLKNNSKPSPCTRSTSQLTPQRCRPMDLKELLQARQSSLFTCNLQSGV